MMSEVPAASTSQAPAAPLDDQSFFSTLLAPGSSLHPTLLLSLDIAFVALFLLFVSLAVATNGNVHILVLMSIEVALWASVRWFVSELRKAQVAESEGPTDSASHGDASSTKPKQE